MAHVDGRWTRPIPPLDLLAGDRLEPSEYLRDVASFENMELPGYVVFWRPSAETVSKHNNPLFSPSLGVGLGTIAIDTLHCLHLGVLKRFVVWFLWRRFEADIFGLSASKLHNQEQELLLNALKTELWKWYDDYHSEHPSANLSRLLEAEHAWDEEASHAAHEGPETLGLLLFEVWSSPGAHHEAGQCLGAPHGGHGRESPCLVDGGITGLISVECLLFTSSFSLLFTSSFPLFCRVDLFLFRTCEQRMRKRGNSGPCSSCPLRRRTTCGVTWSTGLDLRVHTHAQSHRLSSQRHSTYVSQFVRR